MIDSSSKQISVTLTDFLQRQRVLLHGFELRCLRYIPKVSSTYFLIIFYN